MTVDPKTTFWIGVATTIFMGGSYATMWVGWIPDNIVPIIVGTNHFLGFVGTTVLTALTGMSSRAPGPITLAMGH